MSFNLSTIWSFLTGIISSLLGKPATTSGSTTTTTSTTTTVASIGLPTDDVAAVADAIVVPAEIALLENQEHNTPAMVAAQVEKNKQADIDKFNKATQDKDLNTVRENAPQ